MVKWFGFCCYLFLVYGYIRPHFCFVSYQDTCLSKRKKYLQPCQDVWLNLRQLKCIFQQEKSDSCRLLETIICLEHGLRWCTKQTPCLPQCCPDSILDPMSYVGGVCWFSILFCEICPFQMLWFSRLPKNQTWIWFLVITNFRLISNLLSLAEQEYCSQLNPFRDK